jgi:7,8-dihydropterin-6-yl-methyl-4-(beta-D-ribofuranosyl)aminobenzene 5'-phosphate synthase
MGGYHLLPYSAEEISGLLTRLRDDVGVKTVAPAHCTGPLGFKIFREGYGENFLPAGLGSEIRF